MSDSEEDEDEPKPELEPRQSPRFRKARRDSSMPPLTAKVIHRSGGGDPNTSKSENEDAPPKPPKLEFEMLKNKDRNGQINTFDDAMSGSAG